MRANQKESYVRFSWFFIAVFLCLSVTPCHALFDGKVESYSAENVEIAPNGKVVSTSKIYVTPDAMRMDGMPTGGGQGMPAMDITLLVLKKQDKQYLYNHDKKLVFESPVDDEMSKAGYKAMDSIDSEKILGKENVSGYQCIVKEVVTSIDVMGHSIKTKLIVWESDKFEFPLRTEDEEGSIQETRNIKTGKPPNKMFQPLTGYKKVSNMMAVMGMDFGAMMAQEEEMDEEDEYTSDSEDDVDTDALMKHLEQSLGNDMSPEDKAQMMAIMAQAMGQVDQSNPGDGASKDLWKIIPQKPGDKVGYEMRIENIIDVVLGTNSTLQQVFEFYSKQLSSEGWQEQSTHIDESGQGTMSMTKDGQIMMFAWADKPIDLREDFPLHYNIHYIGN